MSWEEPENVRDLEKSALVRASITLGKGSPALTISVGRKVSRALGWHDETRVRIEYGTNSDAGWIRMSMVQDGQKIRFSNKSVKAGSLVVKVQRVIPGLSREYTPVRPCKHVLAPGGDLLIKLPQEFWTSYERKKPYMPKVASRASRAPSTATNSATPAPTNAEKPKQNGAVNTVDAR